MPVHDFDPPQRFVAGTVGPPGQRVFFLQARDARRLISVSCEKEQLTVLADRLLELLDERAGAAGSEAAAAAYADDRPLDTPIEDEFRVNAIGLAWDTERSLIVIECHDHDPDEGEPEDGTALHTLRVSLQPDQAREFARRAGALVAAGRPPCPFCGQALDPSGHICPRANGYRR